MTKRQFLVILYLLLGIIPLTAQTFTEQKKSYPVSADGNKYVVICIVSLILHGLFLFAWFLGTVLAPEYLLLTS